MLAVVRVGVEVVRRGRCPRRPAAAASAIEAPERSASSVASARNGVPPMLASATRPSTRRRRRWPSRSPGGRTSGSPSRTSPPRGRGPPTAARRAGAPTRTGRRRSRRHRPRAPGRAGDLDRAAEGEQRHGQVGRRVGVRERAAERAAVADLRVADLRGGVRRIGASAFTRSEPATSACRVVAPMASSSPSSRMPDSSGIRAMSISTAGWASRSFIIGSSEWPPASSLASSPCSASSDRACAADSATYVVERRLGSCGHLRSRVSAAWPLQRAPRGRCCGSRCSGRSCPRAPRGPPARSGAGSRRAG